MQFLLACGRNGSINVAWARELDTADKLAAAAVAVQGSEIRLAPSRTQPTVKLNDVQMEIWIAAMPRAFVERAAAGESVDLLETSAISLDAPSRRTRLSTAGLAEAIDPFVSSCH